VCILAELRHTWLVIGNVAQLIDSYTKCVFFVSFSTYNSYWPPKDCIWSFFIQTWSHLWVGWLDGE